ncbi:hypothetical protein D3C87_278190 [compost metagenome]
MKPIFILALTCMLLCHVHAQTVANGNFNTGTTSWGCNPETNTESVYGGASTTNTVAEVDAAAGLCQTITGFTIGSYYRLSFLCSRRTTCGPANQSMSVSISGGATRNISRNGTAFSLVSESIDFYATSASHTLTFTGTTTETCNLIVDDIRITLVSGLPVELSAFTATCSQGKVLVNWTTESESRTNYFTIESSADASSWNKEKQVTAQLNSESVTHYSHLIDNRVNGTSYYRLRLTDMDGSEEILALVSLNCEQEGVMIYPNPVKEILSVNASVEAFAGVFDSSGRNVSEKATVWSKNRFDLDFSSFSVGLYYLQVGDQRYKVVKE